MTQKDKYIIEKLYIMDVKTLQITTVTVNEVDECKFALFDFIDSKCSYWLKGPNIQTLSVVMSYHYPQYIVSKDIKSLYWIKESFQWLIGDVGFALLDTWKKIYNEKFDTYKRIR